MSEQKERKHFQRQRNRFHPTSRVRGGPREHEASSSQSSDIRQSQTSSIKLETKLEESGPLSVHTLAEKVSWNFSSQGQENLRKIMAISRDDCLNVLKDKVFRQEIRKQQKRLTKIRKDQKLTEETDTELSYLAISNLLTVSQQIIDALKKEAEPKEAKPTAKSIVRVNQEKQMGKTLATIDEQLASRNYLAARTSIANLLKRFGKDEFIHDKVQHLSNMQSIIELYERQANLNQEIGRYLEKISSINLENSETTLISNTTLKTVKKQLTLSINKQKKKTEPNEQAASPLAQLDKITTILLSFTDPKPERKLAKRQSSVSSLQLKGLSQPHDFLQEAARYCSELLERTGQDKQALLKQLQIMRRNKKKAGQSPYKLIVRLLDIISGQKKEVNDVNLYLKGLSQLYMKKTLNLEAMQTELQKLEEKYNNDFLAHLKPNIEGLIATVQQREKSSKQNNKLELEIKKLKNQNEKLSLSISEQRSKTIEKVPQAQKSDRKKEMEEKRIKETERLRAEKVEKDIEKSLQGVYSNLAERKWKVAKNAINIFIKKFQGVQNPVIATTVRSLSAINTLLTLMQEEQTHLTELQKKEKNIVKESEKQKDQMQERIRSHEEYQSLVKDLLENYSQDKYPLKKVFEDLRRDRKKIVQQKYLILQKLEEPLASWRTRKLGDISETESKNINLTFSAASGSMTERPKRDRNEYQEKYKQLETKSGALNKDIEELLSLIKRIQKGGEWWKFIPKNMKNNAVFKPVYSILQQYRKYELNIQAMEANTTIAQEEQKSLQNAINFTNSLLLKQQSGFTDDFWEKKLSVYKGKPTCDKFIKCLTTLTSYLGKQQAEKQKGELERLNTIITNLERNLSDRERNSQLEQSAKKSVDLKSSRRSSRSRDKKEQKSKELVESYIQDERNYLNKIDQVQKEKQNLGEQIISLQLKAQAIEQELIKAEQKVAELEKGKAQLEKEKYRQFNEINNLKGELEISEGRIHEIQTKLESQVAYFKELSDKVSVKIVEETSKARELEAQNQVLRTSLQQKKATSESTQSRIEQKSEEGSAQKVQGRGPRFDFELDLNSSKVVDFIDNKPRTSRRRGGQGAPREEMPQQQPQEQNQSMKINQLIKEMNLLRQRIDYESSQSKRLQLLIADLTMENNQLKINLETLKLNDRTLDLTSQIESLKVQNARLQEQLNNLYESKRIEIQEQVRIAIDREVNQFNAFLVKDKEEREHYYLHELLPVRIQEELQRYKVSRSPQKSLQIDANSEEFLTLYRQRHQAECAQLKRTFELQLQEDIRNYINNELPIIIDQKKTQWRIEQTEQNQQLIENFKKQWEEQKRQEWVTKEAALQQYWSQLLQQKEQEWSQRYELVTQRQSTVRTQSNLTDVDVLQLVRREEHRAVISVLLNEEYVQWEKNKALEWQNRERQIGEYWQLTVIPKLKLEWEQSKREQFARSIKSNEDDLIQQWKSMFLGSIVEYERNAAINFFIEKQLPGILNEEHRKWVEQSEESSKHEKQLLIQEEWALWNQTKDEEFSKQSKDFEAKLKEIEITYQNQLIQWQEKLFREQQRSSNFEATLKSEREKWLQEKAEIKPQLQNHYEELLASEKNTVAQLKASLLDLQSQLDSQRSQHTQLIHRQRELTSRIDKISQEFTNKLQIEQQRVLHQSSQNTQKLIQETARKIQLEWASKLQAQRQEMSRQAQQFNKQRISSRTEWQRQKKEEIVRVLDLEIKRWEEHKVQEINHILSNERQAWQMQRGEEISVILKDERDKWTRQQATKGQQVERVLQAEFAQKVEIECQHRLASAKAEWELQKQRDWQQWIEAERQSWQQLKTAEIDEKVKEAQLQWERSHLSQQEEQWRLRQLKAVEEAVSRKIVEIEKQFEEVRIPGILQRQFQLWVQESNRNIQAERQRWLNSLPELLQGDSYRIYIQPMVQAQAKEFEVKIHEIQNEAAGYKARIKELEANQNNYDLRITQLLTQISEEKYKLEQSLRQRQQIEAQLTKAISEQSTTRQTILEVQRSNEELTRSKLIEGEVAQLRKVIDRQRHEISNLTSVTKEIEILKKENISLKENNISLESSKWSEINNVREKLEIQILQLSNERNTLLSRITEIETHRHEFLDRESVLSYERQIATLLATIKTKDAEISFLKRSIDSHKEELKEARDQYSEAMEQKSSVERQLTEIKATKLELEYELKYLKEREDSLKKKLQSKEQDLINLRKQKSEQTVQTKSKTNLETLASYQARFNEIESMLSLKTQECQSKAIELDRLRYDVQRNQATIHSANLELESLRMHLKDSESHFSKLKIEYERSQEELGRTKLSLNQSLLREEDASKQINIHIRTIKHEQSEKLRLETQVQRLNDQISRLWRDLNESQKGLRLEAEKVMFLEREMRQLKQAESRQADSAEIQMLNKINNEVSELTATNRQLTMKVVLLENQQRIMAFSPEVLKFFLLFQKHTDLLLDHLLRENIIPSMELYHQFLSDSRPYLASGEIAVYFAKWQLMVRQLFQLCIRSRAEEMRVQAQELLRLKEEMNEILEKQIEASESESGQLVEEYKTVLVDIKSLVREYMSSGDRQYLNLLCSSLGITEG